LRSISPPWVVPGGTERAEEEHVIPGSRCLDPSTALPVTPRLDRGVQFGCPGRAGASKNAWTHRSRLRAVGISFVERLTAGALPAPSVDGPATGGGHGNRIGAQAIDILATRPKPLTNVAAGCSGQRQLVFRDASRTRWGHISWRSSRPVAASVPSSTDAGAAGGRACAAIAARSQLIEEALPLASSARANAAVRRRAGPAVAATPMRASRA
jgi:hypothetical protein